MTVNEAIEVLKDLKRLSTIPMTLREGIDTILLNKAIDTVVAEIERPLPTDEKTVCPECLKKCTNEELRMFGGLCEECSTDFN
jgi:hypothetical protein